MTPRGAGRVGLALVRGVAMGAGEVIDQWDPGYPGLDSLQPRGLPPRDSVPPGDGGRQGRGPRDREEGLDARRQLPGQLPGEGRGEEGPGGPEVGPPSGII